MKVALMQRRVSFHHRNKFQIRLDEEILEA